jgi:hypothetical protein
MGYSYFSTCVLGMKWDSSPFRLRDNTNRILIDGEIYDNIHVFEHEWHDDEKIFRPLLPIENGLEMNCFYGYENNPDIFYFGKQIYRGNVMYSSQESHSWFPDVNVVNSIAKDLVKYLPDSILISLNDDGQIVSESYGLHFYTGVL